MPLPRHDRSTSRARSALLALTLCLVLPARAFAVSTPVITGPAPGFVGAESVHVTFTEDDPAGTALFHVMVARACDQSGPSFDVPSGAGPDFSADVDLGSGDGGYCILVTAHPLSGTDPPAATLALSLDTAAPAPPGTPLSDNHVDEYPHLTWGPGGGDGGGSGIASYTVYRGPVPLVPLAVVPVGDGTRRSYTDTHPVTGASHYFISVTDRMGNESAKGPVDSRYTGPSADVVTGPHDPARSSNAPFTFDGSAPAVAFRCSLDGGPVSGCPASTTLRGIGDGRHTLHLWAIDQNNVQGPETTYSWTVNTSSGSDTTGPNVVIGAPPIAHGAIPVTAQASDPSGVLEIVFQYQAPGGGFTTFADVKQANLTTISVPWLTGGPLLDGTYQLRAIATDTATNATISAPINVVVDNTIPAAPATPTAAASPTRATPAITWAASAGGDVAGYNVYRLGTRVATGVAGTSFSDALPGDGSADGAYPYTVAAVDPAGNESAQSPPVTVVYDTTAPVAPASLTATASATTVTLSWPTSGDPSKGGIASGVAGYVVRRAAGTTGPANPSVGDAVCAVAATVTTCTDAGRAIGQQLSYAVFALDAAGNVSTARTATLTVGATARLPDHTPPGKVLKLKVSVKASRATVTWVKPTAADFDHVQVVVNAKRKPRSATDGTRLYRGKATKAVFLGKAGTSSHVAVFAYDHTGNRSTGAFVDARFARAALEPLAGTAVTGSPRLSWKPVKGASYYNVQVFQIVGRKRVAISWPHATVYSIPRAKLVKGKTYVWYVWPGFGKLADAHYGKLIGHSTFAYR